MKLEKAAAQLEALGNPTRLQLYRILVRAGDEGLPVGRVQEQARHRRPRRCRIICKRLVDTGLVTQERQATTLICRANYPGMDALIGYLADECCADGPALRHPAGGEQDRWRDFFWPYNSKLPEGAKI